MGPSPLIPTTVTVPTAGAQLHVECRGRGPAVVLVGCPMDADAFAPLAEALGTSRTTFPGDHIGFVDQPEPFRATPARRPRPREEPMSATPDRSNDEAAIATAVTTERLALCDTLDTLDPDDWTARSLCTQWTVQDVVAHLTLATHETAWGVIRGVIRARGSWDRMNTDAAREQARRLAPPTLIQQLRDDAPSTRRAPFSSPLDPLTDVLVHGQDITRPLGRTHPMAIASVVPALDHVIASRWYGGSKRFRDVTLRATDADWSFGSGTGEARGRAGDLLLMATGRPAGLAELTGPGVELLATQVG